MKNLYSWIRVVKIFVILLCCTINIFSQQLDFNSKKLIKPFSQLLETYNSGGKTKAIKIAQKYDIDTSLQNIYAEVYFNEKTPIRFSDYSNIFNHTGTMALLSLKIEKLAELSKDSKALWITRPTILKNNADYSPALYSMGGLLGLKDNLTGENKGIAIIDYEWKGCLPGNEFFGNGELPPLTQILGRIDPDFPWLFDGEPGCHGTALLEILYDFAPKANFLLYDNDYFLNGTWIGKLYNCLKDINDNHSNQIDIVVVSQGADVVNADPITGESEISTIIAQLKNKGILVFFAAGNSAPDHIYFEKNSNNLINDLTFNSNTNYLKFGENDYYQFEHQDDLLSLFTFNMQWNDFTNAHNLDFTLELYKINGTSEQLLESSYRTYGAEKPFECLSYFPVNIGNTIYRLKVKKNSNFEIPDNFFIEVFVQDKEGKRIFEPNPLNYLMQYNSIQFPARIEDIISVGAINIADSLEIYSSCGSSWRNYIKPEFVGISGGNSWAYSTLSNETDYFHGTSASCPALAGLALQIIQRDQIPKGAGRRDQLINSLRTNIQYINPTNLEKAGSDYHYNEAIYMDGPSNGNYQFGYGIPIYHFRNGFSQEDNFEPDNSSNQAKNINLGSYGYPYWVDCDSNVLHLATLDDTNDEDWLTFTDHTPTLRYITLETLSPADLLIEVYYKENNSMNLIYSNTDWNINSFELFKDNIRGLATIHQNNSFYPSVLPIPSHISLPGQFYIRIKSKTSLSNPIYYQVALCDMITELEFTQQIFDSQISPDRIAVFLKPEYLNGTEGVAHIDVKNTSTGIIESRLFNNFEDDVNQEQHQVIKGLNFPFSSSNNNLVVEAYRFTGQKESFNYIPVNPILSVNIPNNGEQWHLNNTYSIEWACQGYDGNFNIKLKKSGNISNIAQDVSGREFNWTIPTNIPLGNDYKILVETVDGSLSDESDNNFSILESTTGHDLALFNLELNDDWLTPGQDLGFKFYVKNYGIYTENSYTIKYNLKDSNGNIIAQSETTGVTLMPGETSTQFNRTLILDPLPEGFYEFTVQVYLPNDSYQGNNTEVRSVYIGTSNPYTTFKNINTALITVNTFEYCGDYKVTFIQGSANMIKVKVERSSGGYTDTRWIDKYTVATFDANRFYLIFEGIFNSNQAALEYGNFTQDLSFSPLKVTVEAGQKALFNIDVGNGVTVSDADFYEFGGLDYELVKDWSTHLNTLEYPDKQFSITVPLTATRRQYTFWILIQGSNDYIQKLQIKVIDPTPDFSYTISKTNLTIGEGNPDQTLISLAPLNGFNGQVQMYIDDLPAGVIANFSQNPITPPGQSNITISIPTGYTNFGTFFPNLKLTSSNKNKTVPLVLDIVDITQKFVKILSTNYLDKDNRWDSLSVKYNSNFDNTLTGVTTDWTYSLDGTTFTNINGSQILNNLPKPPGIDSILWKTPMTPVLYSNESYFKMRLKAGPDFLSLIHQQDMGNQTFSGVLYDNNYVYVYSGTNPRQICQLTYTNNSFSIVQTFDLSSIQARTYRLAKYNNQFYMFSESAEICYIFNSSWGLISTKSGLSNYWYAPFTMNGKLYFYNKVVGGNDYLLEVDANLNPTGNSIVLGVDLGAGTQNVCGFYDGKNVWFVGNANGYIYKYSADFSFYDTFPIQTGLQGLNFGGDKLFGTGTAGMLYVFNFTDPYTLYSQSQPFLLNNTVHPTIKNINPVILYENTPKIGGLDLDTLIVDSDTPINQMSINVESTQPENVFVSKNQTDPTLIDFYPNGDWNGIFSFIISVSDGYNYTQKELPGTVMGINDPPQISGIPDTVLQEDHPWIFDLDEYSSDIDNSNAELKFEATVIFSSAGANLKSIKNSFTKIKLKGIDKNNYGYDFSELSILDNTSKIGTKGSINQLDKVLSGNLMIFIDTLSHLVILQGSPNYYADSILVEFKVTDPLGLFDTDTTFIKILPVNDPPTSFVRILPSDSSYSTLTVDQFKWSSSRDVEGSNIEYKFIYRIETTDSVSFTQDTTIIKDLSYINSTSDSLEIMWIPIATDGQLNTYPSNGPGIFTFIFPTKLKWTDDIGYEADGVSPDTGNINSTFAFRVKYIDLNGIPPSNGYPKLHLMKNGSEITGSPFTMYQINVNPFQTGRIYGYDKNNLELGSDYTYYFEAFNNNGIKAKGEATLIQSGPFVTGAINQPPVLTWTNELGYESDGVNPDSGYTSTTFTFRVKYTDPDGDIPLSGYPKVTIKKDGEPVLGSPITMYKLVQENPDPSKYSKEKIRLNNYKTKKIKSKNLEPVSTYKPAEYKNHDVNKLILSQIDNSTKFVEINNQATPVDGDIYTVNVVGFTPGNNYTYHFEAYDINNSPAIGEATIEQNGPIVIDIIPSITLTKPDSNIIVNQYDSVTIEWNANSSISSFVYLYMDTDNILNGNEIPIESSLPENGNYIWYISEVPPGTYYIVGILMDGSYFPNDYADGTVTIVHTFQLSVSIADRWNLVSIPGLHPVNQNVETWWQYKNPNASVFKYVGGSGYQAVPTVIPGLGYWMKNSGARVYNTGDEWPAFGIQIVPHDSFSAVPKWNMFGGYEDTVDAMALTSIPPGKIIFPIYKYVPGSGYSSTTQIVPGYGYWVGVSAPCQIILPDEMVKGNQKVPEFFQNDWGKIILTDAEGNNYTLYAVKGEIDLNRYELPPLPPQGLFDVRFGSSRVAEDINSDFKSIEMRGITYPVRVKIENMDISIQDITGKLINTNIKAGGEITISNPNIDKLKVFGQAVPVKFALEQNFPNPFNAMTTIRFSIPKEVQVNLTVYNILSEKVKELKNEVMKPGSFEEEFDASTVASGVYFYRIKAGDFVQTKKMVLLK